MKQPLNKSKLTVIGTDKVKEAMDMPAEAPDMKSRTEKYTDIPGANEKKLMIGAVGQTDEATLDQLAVDLGVTIPMGASLKEKQSTLKKAIEQRGPYQIVVLLNKLGYEVTSNKIVKTGSKSNVMFKEMERLVKEEISKIKNNRRLKESLAKDIAMYITDDEKLLNKFTGNFFKDDLKKEIMKYAKQNKVKVGDMEALQKEVNQMLDSMHGGKNKVTPERIKKSMAAGFEKREKPMNEIDFVGGDPLMGALKIVGVVGPVAVLVASVIQKLRKKFPAFNDIISSLGSAAAGGSDKVEKTLGADTKDDMMPETKLGKKELVNMIREMISEMDSDYSDMDNYTLQVDGRTIQDDIYGPLKKTPDTVEKIRSNRGEFNRIDGKLLSRMIDDNRFSLPLPLKTAYSVDIDDNKKTINIIMAPLKPIKEGTYNNYEAAINAAKKMSKMRDNAVHVKEMGNGMYTLTDEYDQEDDTTVASFLKGQPITETKKNMKKQELKEFIKKEIKNILNK